jgi:hypothetical protein
MEDYHWAMFIHAMDFFLYHASLKKSILEDFFPKSIVRFVNKGFGFPWQLPINIIYET